MGDSLFLHFGVIDIPYAEAPKKHARKVKPGTQTTGDVAGWIEEKYGLFETFAELHMDDVIAPALEDSIEGAFEDLLAGAPFGANIFGSAESKITEAFQVSLDKREYDGLIDGVATAAAERGVNHRLKRPYRKRAPRPSFIDTGLLQVNSRAWVDGNET